MYEYLTYISEMETPREAEKNGNKNTRKKYSHLNTAIIPQPMSL